jgi:hypothetical protein
LRSTNICIVDEQGELIAEGKTDSEVVDIVAFLDGLDFEISLVGLEAGTLTQYLTYCLQFAGFDHDAENVCCALEHVQKPSSPNRPTYARSGWPLPVPTA